MAKLFFRYGAMNCGKSTMIMQIAHNYEERGMKVMVMKPSLDTKGENKVVSRIGITRKVDYLLKKDDNVFEIVKKNYRNISCLLVDEAQFLTKEQVDELMFITTELDIPVLCYGLRTDFTATGFPGSTRLLEIAHTIEEVKTICSCGRKALYNARFVNDEFTLSGAQVVIDGSHSVRYVSMCAKCYFKEVKKYNKSKKN